MAIKTVAFLKTLTDWIQVKIQPHKYAYYKISNGNHTHVYSYEGRAPSIE